MTIVTIVLFTALIIAVLVLQRSNLKMHHELKDHRDRLDTLARWRQEDFARLGTMDLMLKEQEKKIEVAAELSVINNKFIETVKQTAKEQAEASKSRIATLQNRYLR